MASLYLRPSCEHWTVRVQQKQKYQISCRMHMQVWLLYDTPQASKQQQQRQQQQARVRKDNKEASIFDQRDLWPELKFKFKKKIHLKPSSGQIRVGQQVCLSNGVQRAPFVLCPPPSSHTAAHLARDAKQTSSGPDSFGAGPGTEQDLTSCSQPGAHARGPKCVNNICCLKWTHNGAHQMALFV